jgi:hypothetical protein
MKDKAARAVRSRRKMLAKRYTKRMGQRCIWEDGQLVIEGKYGPTRVFYPVMMRGGKAVTLDKKGQGTGAAQTV